MDTLCEQVKMQAFDILFFFLKKKMECHVLVYGLYILNLHILEQKLFNNVACKH